MEDANALRVPERPPGHGSMWNETTNGTSRPYEARRLDPLTDTQISIGIQGSGCELYSPLCVQSLNYPLAYGTQEVCTVTAHFDGYLVFDAAFQTQTDADVITVPSGAVFSGSIAPVADGGGSVFMKEGDAFTHQCSQVPSKNMSLGFVCVGWAGAWV